MDGDRIRLTARSFSAGALLKFGAICVGSLWMLFGAFFGVLALLHIFPVNLNGVPTYGIGGLIGGLFIGLFLSGVGALIVMIGGLLARVLPKIQDIGIDVEVGSQAEFEAEPL